MRWIRAASDRRPPARSDAPRLSADAPPDPFAYGPMGAHRVEADVDPENEASLALLTRLGFTEEGRARERWSTFGTWKDAVLLAQLASDLAG